MVRSPRSPGFGLSVMDEPSEVASRIARFPTQQPSEGSLLCGQDVGESASTERFRTMTSPTAIEPQTAPAPQTFQ